jgi:hypothetical protein
MKAKGLKGFIAAKEPFVDVINRKRRLTLRKTIVTIDLKNERKRKFTFFVKRKKNYIHCK